MANLFLALFSTIAICGLVAALGAIVWLSRVVPRHVAAKYPREVLLKCRFPYPSNWESLVDRADAPLFRQYRRALLTWYASAAVIAIIEVIIWQKI